MMSIFSPRSSRMMDCTRMPFMPTQAPTLSTSRSRLEHGDLGALAGFARAAFDHHRVVVNLRHFLLEQAHHQLRRGARNDHARRSCRPSPRCLITQRTRSPTLKFSSLRLLLLGQPRFGLAQIHAPDPGLRCASRCSSPARPRGRNTPDKWSRARLRAPFAKSPAWRSGRKCGPARRSVSGSGLRIRSPRPDRCAAPPASEISLTGSSTVSTTFFTAKVRARRSFVEVGRPRSSLVRNACGPPPAWRP